MTAGVLLTQPNTVYLCWVEFVEIGTSSARAVSLVALWSAYGSYQPNLRAYAESFTLYGIRDSVPPFVLLYGVMG
jgi:hypothetical protein